MALHWTVSKEKSGIKLLTFLVQALQSSSLSARQIKKVIEQNRCRVNGRCERFASYLLGVGDAVQLDITTEEASPNAQTKIEPLTILFEDEDLLIYDKPAGVSCDPKGIRFLTSYCPQLKLVHRLDRNTTGILLLAKNEAAEKDLLSQFKQRLVEKCYAAIVGGRILKKKGFIENRLEKKRTCQGQSFWGETDKAQGLYAFTEWELKKAGNDASFVYCYPKTGRTHQLRVHLAGIGHPILGDFQYARSFRCAYTPKRHLLHACELEFLHPSLQNKMQIRSHLPEDFCEAMEALDLR